MLLNVPGFAPAWETAKAEAHNEMGEEESGRSAPKRMFARLFGGGTANAAVGALPNREGNHSGHDSDAKVTTEN
jgi:hypothetical protein